MSRTYAPVLGIRCDTCGRLAAQFVGETVDDTREALAADGWTSSFHIGVHVHTQDSCNVCNRVRPASRIDR